MDRDSVLMLIWLFVNPISTGMILACFEYFHWVSDMQPVFIAASIISMSYLVGLLFYRIFFDEVST